MNRGAGLIFSDCPDSFYGSRCRYFNSGSDARRCPAGGVVAKCKKINKMFLPDCVLGGFVV